MEIIAFAVILGICALLTWMIAAIVNAIFEHKELKKRMAHPQFYGWIAELDEMVCAEVKFHNTEISPLIREIDAVLEDLEYCPTEIREFKEYRAEELRGIVYAKKEKLRKMEIESGMLRARIRAYNKEHNLESGWND